MSVYTYDEEIFSDLHKDVYGFRPRGHAFYSADPAEKQRIWDDLLVDLDAENQRFAEQQRQNVADFERLVAQNVKHGAVDRKTAIQWLIDAEGDDFYDYGYMEYNYGLPYGFLEKEVA